GLGFLAGWVALRLSWSQSPLRPTSPWHWLPYLALLAVLTGLHDLTYALQRSRLARVRAAAGAFPRASRAGRPRRLAVAVRVGGGGAWLWYRGEGGGGVGWAGGLGAFFLWLWLGLAPLTRLWPGPLLPALLAVVAVMVAALVFLAHFAMLAQITGVLVAV